jgi:hypothetical protein
MRVVLVNPPKSRYDVEELAPPLGLLRLARVAHNLGATVYVEDYNLLWHLDEQLRSSFYETATERLVGLGGDVYGFTSMAVDSHVALELARRIKRERREATMVFGGSHFSSIAQSLRDSFPWVDVVIRGEGELAFEEFLRERNGRVATAGSPLPRPLYDVVQFPAYFHVNPARMVNLEAGRGCRFQCAFCYSPTHYEAFRYFSIDSVIEELAVLPALGARHVWFVEDNFLNDSKRALDLCEAIRSSRLGLTWSCYATFPQLTELIVAAMARAGCTGVFSGIDAVGADAERAFHKSFLRGRTPVEVKTRWMLDAGITPTYAFMLAPPSHSAGRTFGVTTRTALEARVSGAEVILNPLNLYSGTRSHAAYPTTFAADDRQVRLMMDVPDVVAKNQLASSYPNLFPFHARYVGEREWHRFLEVSHCVSTLVSTYPNTMASLVAVRGIDPVAVAEKTLQRFSDWSRLETCEVRRVEQDAGFFTLEELVPGTAASGILERERESTVSQGGVP